MSQPNVFLIILDSLRERTFRELLDAGELPTIATIAESGQQFRNATTNAPWTLPSHSSIFTGKRSNCHKTHAGSTSFADAGATLAEQLSTRGYTTLGISGNSWVSPEFGFDRGFDNLSMKWDYTWKGADLSTVSRTAGPVDKARALLRAIDVTNAPHTLLNSLYGKFIDGGDDMGGENTTRRACRWIDKSATARQPFFFFINYLEPHLEYDPPQRHLDRFLPDVPQTRIDRINQNPWEYVSGEATVTDEDFEILEGLYKAEAAYVDELIGKIRAKLEANGLLADTCFIIIGDHGENIGDHQLMDHQYCLYETLLNVPLVVQYPDGEHSGTVVDSPVETRDVFPTVLSMAGIEVPSDTDVSKNDLKSSPGREYVISEYRVPQPSMESIYAEIGHLPEKMEQYDRALRSIRYDGWKLIDGSDGATELYQLQEDPYEQIDLSEQEDAKVTELLGMLDEKSIPSTLYTDREDSTDEEMSDSTKTRLEDLGYI